MLASFHPRQEERLAALQRYEILDTPGETEFDDIVQLVAEICEAPVAVVNFIDSDRQWFKAEVGLGVCSTPLETSLCSHIILQNDFVEIPDTLDDPRMCDNPLCTGDGGFRFYAGALLKTPDGLPLGTLCVLDRRPRALTPLQRRTIKLMADRVMSELNLRLALRRQSLLRREIDHRVKNSLASVGAIIGLQSARSATCRRTMAWISRTRSVDLRPSPKRAMPPCSVHASHQCEVSASRFEEPFSSAPVITSTRLKSGDW